MAPDSFDFYSAAPLSTLLTSSAPPDHGSSGPVPPRMRMPHFLQSPSLHTAGVLPLPHTHDGGADAGYEHVWQDVLQAGCAPQDLDYSHSLSHNAFDQHLYSEPLTGSSRSPLSTCSPAEDKPLDHTHNSTTATCPVPPLSASGESSRPRIVPGRRGRRANTDAGRVQRRREEKMQKERVRRALLNDRFGNLAQALQLPEDSRADRLTLLTDSLAAIRVLQAEVARLRTQLACKEASLFLL